VKKRYLLLLCGTVALSVAAVQAPAAWLGWAVQHYSQGAVSFAHSWGTVWAGSAQCLIRRSERESLLVPQPIAWTLTEVAPFATQATLTVSSAALQTPVALRLTGSGVAVDAGQYSLPADSLNTLGAPFNTLKPTGAVAVNWGAFQTSLNASTPPTVPLTVSVQGLRSSVTGDQPLGNYAVALAPTAGNRWTIALSTTNPDTAALLLSGTGSAGLTGNPQFELTAKAATPAAEQRLQALLNFLGRKQGDAYVLRVN
jgi:general secretion pathway protein N